MGVLTFPSQQALSVAEQTGAAVTPRPVGKKWSTDIAGTVAQSASCKITFSQSGFFGTCEYRMRQEASVQPDDFLRGSEDLSAAMRCSDAGREWRWRTVREFVPSCIAQNASGAPRTARRSPLIDGAGRGLPG